MILKGQGLHKKRKSLHDWRNSTIHIELGLSLATISEELDLAESEPEI